MNAGCRALSWSPSRRWRNLIRASGMAAVIIAILVAIGGGVDRLRHSPSGAYTDGPGAGVATMSPAAGAPTSSAVKSHRSAAVDDYPRPTDTPPSAATRFSAPPELKHLARPRPRPNGKAQLL